MSNNEFIITNTNSIEGRTIENYQGTVIAPIAAGTNLFCDMFAGLNDIIGGRLIGNTVLYA